MRTVIESTSAITFRYMTLLLLRRFPELDEDELSRLSGLTLVRRVKRFCRDLVTHEPLERVSGPNGRNGNYALGAEPWLDSLGVFAARNQSPNTLVGSRARSAAAMNRISSVSFRHSPLPEGGIARHPAQGGTRRNAIGERGLEFFRRAYLVNIFLVRVHVDREMSL